MTTSTHIFAAAGFAAALGFASAAGAASLGTLDAGFSIGTSNSADNFMIDTNVPLGIEIGVKAKERFVGDLPVSGGVYSAIAGEGGPGLSTWNIEFSIAVDAFSLIGDFDVFLTLDFDPAVGNTNLAVFDVNQPLAVGVALLQASQNLGFDFWGLSGVPNAGGFDPDAAGEYFIGLDVFLKGTTTSLASTSAIVSVAAAPVPLPAGLPLLLAGLGGLAVLRRRKG